MQEFRRDHQQICLKRGKSEPFEGERQVDTGRSKGDVVEETYNVDGPQIVVHQALPEETEGNGFPIVHRAFAGVISYYSVDHNYLLPVRRLNKAIRAAPIQGAYR